MSETTDIKLAIASVMERWANERLANARGILDKFNANASRNLSQSLMYEPVTIEGNNITLRVGFSTGKDGQNPADYYKYVDEGVKGIGFAQQQLKGREARYSKTSAFGTQRSALTTGRYSYKTPFVSKSMVKSIQQWIADKGVAVRTSKNQSKQSVIKQAENLSWAIAKNIKKTGIGKTMFWSDTFNDNAFADLATLIEKELGGEFRVNIQV